MSEEEVVRIFRYEKSDGTYFYPQRKVWKNRWFSESGYKWEYFAWMEGGEITSINPSTVYCDTFKDIEVARLQCRKYMRVHHGDKVVEVFKLK